MTQTIPTTEHAKTLDHQGMVVLTPEECWRLVESVPVGRVAFLDGGDPMILPVNHARVAHHVVFRTLRGTLLDEALMGKPVAFEVDGWDAPARTGWSVVIRGVADLPADEDALRAMGLDAWADSVERSDWVQITAEEITGRKIDR